MKYHQNLEFLFSAYQRRVHFKIERQAYEARRESFLNALGAMKLIDEIKE